MMILRIGVVFGFGVSKNYSSYKSMQPIRPTQFKGIRLRAQMCAYSIAGRCWQHVSPLTAQAKRERYFCIFHWLLYYWLLLLLLLVVVVLLSFERLFERIVATRTFASNYPQNQRFYEQSCTRKSHQFVYVRCPVRNVITHSGAAACVQYSTLNFWPLRKNFCDKIETIYGDYFQWICFHFEGWRTLLVLSISFSECKWFWISCHMLARLSSQFRYANKFIRSNANNLNITLYFSHFDFWSLT